MNAVLKRKSLHRRTLQWIHRVGSLSRVFGTCSIFKDSITHEACRVVIDIPLQSYLEDVCSDEWVHAIWIARNENVSHSVCGPDFIGKRFAKSCPYFDSSKYENAYKEERHKELDQWTHSMMLESCSPEIFWLFQFCVESFVFQIFWLDKNNKHGNKWTLPFSILVSINAFANALSQDSIGTILMTLHSSMGFLWMFCTCCRWRTST